MILLLFLFHEDVSKSVWQEALVDPSGDWQVPQSQAEPQGGVQGVDGGVASGGVEDGGGVGVVPGGDPQEDDAGI